MLKIQRIWGSVTGFARSMDEAFIDAFTEELNGSLQGMADIFEFGILYACSNDLGFTGDAFQYSGIFPHLAAGAPANIIDAGGAKVSLGVLDAALEKVGAFRQSRNDPKLWMMGLQMKQIVDGLQTKIQIPLTSTVLNDGQVVMANYANSPIFETDYLVPEETSTSPDDLAGVAAAGGNLNASVAYRIASVSAFGEQAASAATDAIDATGSKKVTLSWTADPNAKLYHIFR